MQDSLARHVAILCASYQRLTGKLLVPDNVDPVDWLDQAPFALVSHDTAADPVFNYANRAALRLFEMTWDEFTSTPSRLSAAPMDRDERAALLERVTRNGYIDDYTGVRVAKSGRRFMIRNATVFNLLDEQGRHYGQAALLAQWEALQ
jgi:hypothetical protein